ncbi:MAG: hypothetical protein RIQ33_2206 [Bacteroidota bacterium]|jgi:hypothetical protein
MKKTFLILFTMLYLCFVIGVSISNHFCGGKLSFISFYNQVDEKDCCSGNHTDDCCMDENYFLKSNDNHQHETPIFQPAKTIIHHFYSLNHFFNNFLKQISVTKTEIFPPPDKTAQQPFYIQFQVFRI